MAKKHDAAYSCGFHSVILSPCWALQCPMAFFRPFYFLVISCLGAMANITDACVDAMLHHIRCMGIFFNPLFSTWCFERNVQFDDFVEKELFSLNQQEFLYEQYRELNLNELQCSVH